MQENTPPLFVAKTQCSHRLRDYVLRLLLGSGICSSPDRDFQFTYVLTFTTWIPCMRSKIRSSIWLTRWDLQCDLATAFATCHGKAHRYKGFAQCAADRARCMQTVYISLLWLDDWSIHDTTCVLNNYVTVKMLQWIMELEALTDHSVHQNNCIYIYMCVCV